jgi:hypothetical protein
MIPDVRRNKKNERPLSGDPRAWAERLGSLREIAGRAAGSSWVRFGTDLFSRMRGTGFREEARGMDWLRMLEPGTLAMLIPIVALLVGGAIVITKMVIHHRERLAMIERGINPDAPQQQR